MHEVSLVRSLLTQVQRLVATHGGGTVRTIRLQCGALCGVEPALVASAFDFLRDEYDFPAANLLIEGVPLEVRCDHCQITFSPEGFRFACPHCGSGATQVVRGENVLLESIEIDPLLAEQTV